MFNFRVDRRVPGFRVGMGDDVPGFRMMPDGSTETPDIAGVSDPNDNATAPVDPGFQPVAAGDLRCQGGDCRQGGDWGTTAAYHTEGKNLCAKCIVKRLGFENEPSSALPGLLVPWTLGGKK